MEKQCLDSKAPQMSNCEDLAGTPAVIEEIEIEELAVDGICGIY